MVYGYGLLVMFYWLWCGQGYGLRVMVWGYGHHTESVTGMASSAGLYFTVYGYGLG